MRQINWNGTLFALHIPLQNKKKGESVFYSDESDFIQVASHSPEKGKLFSPHYHLENKRLVTKTQEVLLVQSGSLFTSIYTIEGELIDSFLLNSGEMIILLNGAHGFEVKEEGTHFIEFKNGPYLGAEKDRKRIVE